MTEAKHTPGPWSVFNDPKSNYGLQVNANNAIKAKKVICRVGGPDRDANARLLSAAPDMLEALIDLCNRVDEDTNYVPESEAYLRARAAIAKATGA